MQNETVIFLKHADSWLVSVCILQPQNVLWSTTAAGALHY